MIVKVLLSGRGGGLFDSEFSEIRNLNPYEPQRAFSPLQKIPCFEKMTVQLIGNGCKFCNSKKENVNDKGFRPNF